MGKGRRILRLWTGHMLLLVVTAVVAVAAILTPLGVPDRFEFLESMSPEQRAAAIAAGSRPRFEWQRYKAAVTTYVTDLRRGFVPYQIDFDRVNNFLDYIKHQFVNSWRLFRNALLLGIGGGLLLGALYALRSRLGRSLHIIVAVTGLSLPEFSVIVGMQALTILSVQNTGETLWPILASPGQPRGWVVPLTAMTLAPLAYVARLSASALDDILKSDYIRTARSKGVPEWRIVLLHAGRNALPRLAAGLPTLLGIAMSSLIIVERMTLWPGLLKYVIDTGGTWHVMGPTGERYYTGSTPQMMATATLILLVWYIAMDAAARTAVIAGSDTGREMRT